MARWCFLMILLTLIAWGTPRTPIIASAHPGTLAVPSQYSTIQKAVDAAIAGDTILVASGVYKENVVVTKNVNITGASRATAIIDANGNGPGVNITGANSVSLQGFTINDTGIFDTAIFVNSSSFVVISNNKLTASTQSDAVYVTGSNQISVLNNLIEGNRIGVSVYRMPSETGFITIISEATVFRPQRSFHRATRTSGTTRQAPR